MTLPTTDTDARLTKLETELMFVQRLLEDLNQVVIAQQQRIEQQENELKRLRGTVTGLGDAMSEPPRRLEDDKPPHY
ncbi:MAG: SlyX family protein [Planctomycetota bacterium]|nr:SlyX family protein [Planctomycetota bacterium]